VNRLRVNRLRGGGCAVLAARFWLRGGGCAVLAARRWMHGAGCMALLDAVSHAHLGGVNRTTENRRNRREQSRLF
jgi:hypothetical protein